MTLQQLKYFVAVSKTANYHAAAQNMMVSEPALCKSIASLERELGFLLFARKGRRIELTKYGALYAQEVESLLNQLETSTKKVQGYAHFSDGRIDIACSSSLLRDYLPQILHSFLNQPGNERLQFHFQNDYSLQIVQRLKNMESDIGFCSLVPDAREITFVSVLEEELIVIVPVDHPLANLREIDLAMIQPYPFISYSNSAALHSYVMHCLEEANIRPFIVCETVDESAIAALVAEGLGISLVAKVSSLTQFQVKAIPIRSPKHSRTQYMAFNSQAYLTPAVKRFIEFVQTVPSDLTLSNMQTDH